MRRRARNQLVLDLDQGGRPVLPVPVADQLLQALADLLLEALGNRNKGIALEREGRDASEDQA